MKHVQGFEARAMEKGIFLERGLPQKNRRRVSDWRALVNCAYRAEEEHRYAMNELEQENWELKERVLASEERQKRIDHKLQWIKQEFTPGRIAEAVVLGDPDEGFEAALSVLLHIARLKADAAEEAGSDEWASYWRQIRGILSNLEREVEDIPWPGQVEEPFEAFRK